jgi:NAD(P)H dehydrogenase (quinone)
MGMYVVTGVTGKLGRVAVEELLEQVPAGEVAVVARDPRKAADLAERGVDVRHGDYEDPASLRTAFAGADVLLFVSSPDITPGTRPRQHGNVVDAAVAAGVGRVVYTSAIGAADATPGFLADHTVTEELLTASGLPHTALRNTFYLEALVNPGLRAAVDAGELLGADEGSPVNFATIADLGLAAARALTGAGHPTAYELRGPVFTVADLARTVSEASGRTVTYRPVPVEAVGEAGFVHQLIASGLFSQPSDDLEKLIGRPPTSLREAVEAVLRG